MKIPEQAATAQCESQIKTPPRIQFLRHLHEMGLTLLEASIGSSKYADYAFSCRTEFLGRIRSFWANGLF
jgi:hypothetical protein